MCTATFLVHSERVALTQLHQRKEKLSRVFKPSNNIVICFRHGRIPRVLPFVLVLREPRQAEIESTPQHARFRRRHSSRMETARRNSNGFYTSAMWQHKAAMAPNYHGLNLSRETGRCECIALVCGWMRFMIVPPWPMPASLHGTFAPRIQSLIVQRTSR